MGARAAKNPTVPHYPDITTPMEVTAAPADPRPGYEDDGPWANGGPVPDPLGFVNKLVPGKNRFPKGEQAQHDPSWGHKGKSKG